jgi:hypothetical protein
MVDHSDVQRVASKVGQKVSPKEEPTDRQMVVPSEYQMVDQLEPQKGHRMVERLAEKMAALKVLLRGDQTALLKGTCSA